MIDFEQVRKASTGNRPFDAKYMGLLCDQAFRKNIGTDGQRAALKRILEQLGEEQTKFLRSPEHNAVSRFLASIA